MALSDFPAEPAPPGDVRDRILRAFTERARHHGLRAVVMAEVARDLSISTKTLYKVFDSKEQVVQGLMERWAAFIAALERVERTAPPSADVRDGLRDQAVIWAEVRARFSPIFWEELERDYPGPFAVFAAARERARGVIRDRITPLLRDEVDAELAQELFDAVTRRAADPDLCHRLGITPHDALVQAVEIWTAGALR